MSSPIELRLAPSAIAGLLAILPWLVLAGFVLAASASGWPVLLLSLPVVIGFAWRSYQRQGLLQGANAVVALKVGSQGLACRCADGEELPVTVDSASSLGASFLALKLRAPVDTSGTLFTLIISGPGPWANASQADVRRLTTWLRLGQARSA